MIISTEKINPISPLVFELLTILCDRNSVRKSENIDHISPCSILANSSRHHYTLTQNVISNDNNAFTIPLNI